MMRLVFTIAIFFCVNLASASMAQSPPLPIEDGLTHTGVISCATAGCHGDQVSGPGAGTIVGQNEYFKWRSPGPLGAHSRSYQTLLSSHSKRIAQNLGIGPAHEAQECLSCHADNAPEDKRSERFQISDGVGCEACHGGAQNWLAFHRIGAGHDKNIEMGLYPTEDPIARGNLCLSCHLGSDVNGQFVSHRIMGAGHPRIKFELDLYTTLQKHHTIDDDYRQRKHVAPNAQVWALGQALSLKRTLELLTNQQIAENGAFPELAFFDCHACHQPISDRLQDLSWRANPYRALGPGAPVLNDANAIMLLAIARVLDAEMAQKMERQGRTLHAASQNSRSAFHQAALELKLTADEMMKLILNTDFSSKQTVYDLLYAVLDQTLSERYTNYASGEQALFAVQRLIADLPESSISADLTTAVEKASEHVQSPYAYNQHGFRRALNEIKNLMQ